MAKIKRYTSDDGGYHGELGFMCPGCKQRHFIYDKETTGHTSPIWDFNGDFEKPTVRASILVRWPANPNASDEFKEWRIERVCHSFITDGKIQFLSDCTHSLAGQTVELPEIE